ncbi:MAG TPA: cupin domain-containing protein [Bacteroidales bacterium]|nr:cupin domain-containing protein [Bacteroidales bacterium]
METNIKYTATDMGPLDEITRVMLKDTLGLTGAEISANRMQAGASSPFAHAHKRNEEIYLFISGKGFFWLDGDVITVREGSVVKVPPATFRYLKADEEGLSYFCIQVDEGSLVQATRDDGIRSDEIPRF